MPTQYMRRPVRTVLSRICPKGVEDFQVIQSFPVRTYEGISLITVQIFLYLVVQLATALDTAMSVNMTQRWTQSKSLWTSMDATKAEVSVKIASTTLRESTATGANWDSTDLMAFISTTQMFVNVSICFMKVL
jgi:hypothetical protein